MTEPLQRLKDLYEGGFLTRDDLYARIMELRPPVDTEQVRRYFGTHPDLVTGLADWQRAIAAGATVFGGEYDFDRQNDTATIRRTDGSNPGSDPYSPR